jgi:hypothetical protein
LTNTNTTSELEYKNPYTNEEITDEELQKFCSRNTVILTRKELHELYQQKLLDDKHFLYEVVESDFDIDTKRLMTITETCSQYFNPDEFLRQRQELVMKNLERISRRSHNSDHWKCGDCKITADVYFMYQHTCSESRLKKKKSSTMTTKAKAKDKKSVVTKTVFWAGESKDTPPSSSKDYYSGPAWLIPTCHSGKQASDQCGLGGA